MAGVGRRKVVDPEQRIVDPHHHLWPPAGRSRTASTDLRADTGGGHRVERTVFIECGAAYRTDGPPDSRRSARPSSSPARRERSGGLIAGIVAHADLRLANLDEVLDAHAEAGGGLFRGIRHAGRAAIRRPAS